MKNPDLYDALKEYCRSAVKFLNSKTIEFKSVPHTLRYKAELDEKGGSRLTPYDHIEWGILIHLHLNHLKEMPEYRTSTQALEEDKRFRMHNGALVGPGSYGFRVDADIVLQSFLGQLLDRQQSLLIDDFEFDIKYRGLEELLYNNTLKYRCFSPLHRFRMERERIELGSGLSIITIPKKEKETIISEASKFWGPSSLMDLSFMDFAFECFVSVPKIIEKQGKRSGKSFPIQMAKKKLDQACIALRLFKSGFVSYNGIRLEAAFWEPYGGTYGGISTSGSSLGPMAGGKEYFLANQEIPAFSDLWDIYKKTLNLRGNRIEIALRRLNFAYERARLEDKLIDYLIGLEALLLRKNERQELGYRLALRGSALLGNKNQKRKSIFRDLKKAYKERSDIVHGGGIKEYINIGRENVPFKDFVNRVEEHLRSALKQFLVLCEEKSESQILSGLDQKIVAGSLD